MNSIELVFSGDNDERIRLDKYLSREIENSSRSYLQKLIKEGYVKVSSSKKKTIKPAYNLKPGDRVTVRFPQKAEEGELKIWKKDLDIIAEDEHLAVINKPAPLVVHPAESHEGRTLVSALLHNFANLSRAGGKNRPGIVHRLDKGTSGAIVIAKTDQSYYSLKEQFKAREVKKTYYALVIGTPEHKKARIEAPIARDRANRTRYCVDARRGKEAISRYRVKRSFAGFSLVEVDLITGRTHQIRVHFSFLGYPVLGDDKYGGKSSLKIAVPRQMLHSGSLEFKHPAEGRRVEYEAPLPKDFKNIKNHIAGL